MSGKFDFSCPIVNIAYVGPSYSKKLEILGIKTAEDMLRHFPFRYLDYSHQTSISQTKIGEIQVVCAKLISIKSEYTKTGKNIQKAIFQDKSGQITAIWFNQRFLVNVLKEGTLVNLAGKIDFWGPQKAFLNPDYEIVNGKNIHTTGLVPIYPETAGVSSKWLRARIKNLLNIKPGLVDPLPSEIIEKYGLIDIQSAFGQIHFPKNKTQASRATARFAFEELFLLQLANIKSRYLWEKNNKRPPMKIFSKEIDSFIDGLDFKLTSSQTRAISEILADLKKPIAMNRILEGDVGSGKTIVAAIAAYNTFLHGQKTFIMAPTEILARQHYQNLSDIFAHTKLKVGLITGATKSGKDADLIVGTHALINIPKAKNLGLVVIDEQHRFGVSQRAYLLGKEKQPHLLTMTATPIPRSIALTIFGDLDISVLTEKPQGRQRVKTWVVPNEKRQAAYNWIKTQIDDKGQVFVVCPLVEKSEVFTTVKSAKEEYLALEKIFPDVKIGLLHGQMKSDQKNEVLTRFKNKEIDILVSTPVVEVGVDIPNATILVIEAAERFGLAQLHQLRGRVGRSDKQSYCLLFTNIAEGKPLARLQALTRYDGGNKLALLDLKLRGPGEIYGTTQHGFPQLKVARYDDVEKIKSARQAAAQIFKKIQSYPYLQEMLKKDKIDRLKLN